MSHSVATDDAVRKTIESKWICSDRKSDTTIESFTPHTRTHTHTPNMGRTDTIGPDNYLSRKSESTISFYCLRLLLYIQLCAAYLTVHVRNSIDCCLCMCVIRHVMTDDHHHSAILSIEVVHVQHMFSLLYTLVTLGLFGAVALPSNWINIIRTWLRCRSILYLIRIWYPMN